MFANAGEIHNSHLLKPRKHFPSYGIIIIINVFMCVYVHTHVHVEWILVYYSMVLVISLYLCNRCAEQAAESLDKPDPHGKAKASTLYRCVHFFVSVYVIIIILCSHHYHTQPKNASRQYVELIDLTGASSDSDSDNDLDSAPNAAISLGVATSDGLGSELCINTNS